MPKTETKKSDATLQNLCLRRDKAAEAIRAMADTLEAEHRTRTEDEETQYRSLLQERQQADMRIAAHLTPGLPQAQTRTAWETIQERMADPAMAGKSLRLELRTAGPGKVSDLTTSALVPVVNVDVLKPLEKGLILSKVGIPLRSGMVGKISYTAYSPTEATVAGEAIAVTAQNLEFSKLDVNPQRICVGYEVSREELDQSAGKVEEIVMQDAPLAVARVVNKCMFSVDKVGTTNNLVGPFVAAKSTAKILGVSPTVKTLNTMRAAVAAEGIDASTGGCWVMSAGNKCLLESTPKDAGSGRMLIEDDMLLGRPVFVTEYIGDTYIGFGDFTYQAAGVFGQPYLTVDPYTGAGKNTVYFWLNVDWGTVTLRTEAFVLGKVAAS